MAVEYVIALKGKVYMFFVVYSGIIDLMVIPMQERLEEWKKSSIQLDKDHAKGKTQLSISIQLSIILPRHVIDNRYLFT